MKIKIEGFEEEFGIFSASFHEEKQSVDWILPPGAGIKSSRIHAEGKITKRMKANICYKKII